MPSIFLISKRVVFFFMIFSFIFQKTNGQEKTYKASLIKYQHHYINKHEAVPKNDRKYINFYDIDESFRVNAAFKRIVDTIGFQMNTSSGMQKTYFIYGLLTFRLHDSILHLYVYQAAALMQQKKYREYLFVPFGDATSGFTSYGGGRYIEFYMSDIKDNRVTLDFNKAYNPYCAYTTGYNCPIPPKENLLTVPIAAGEKTLESLSLINSVSLWQIYIYLFTFISIKH